MIRINLKNQRGFTLIEALFSSIVLGIGVLALAGFHAVALQDGALIKMRMVATNLAQEKIDDLKSFTELEDDPDTVADECGAGTFCYSEIAANAGGQEDAGGSLVLPSGTVQVTVDGTTYSQVSGTAYTRTWTVACYSESAGAAPTLNSGCTDADFKLVTVTIAWTDNKGASQSTSLQAVIYGVDPSDLTRAAANPAASSGPSIGYTPQTGSIPIEIGGGKSTETSKPLPEVYGGDSRTVTLPSVIYIGSNGNEELVSREEYTTVNCTCTLGSSSTGWTPHRTVWNGSALEQEYGVEVTKPVGEPNDLDAQGNTNQSPQCIACCRDHHDTNADADTDASGTQYYPAYRPYVATSEFDASTGDHKHYKSDNTVAVVGEDYVEACRMKRIGGYWRVVPDWLLIDLAAMGCDHFVDTATTECPPSATESSTKLTTYRDRVRDVLQSFVSYLNTNKTVDTTSSALPTFTNGVASLLDTSNSADDIEVVNGGSKQLLARGIYADVVFKRLDSGSARTVDTDYVDVIYPIYSQDSFDLLQYLPFYDANLTLLAEWSPTSTDTAGNLDYGDCAPSSPSYNTTPTPDSAVCVQNEAISTIDNTTTPYYDDYYHRGKIVGKAASGSTLITASVARGNNGLTASPSIDGASSPTLTSTVKAKIPTGVTTQGITGTIVRGNSGADLTLVDWVASPSTGVTCALNTPSSVTSTSSYADYTCDVPSGWSGTLTFFDNSATSVYSFKLQDGTVYSPYTITAPATVTDVYAYGETASVYGTIYCVNTAACNEIQISTSSGGTCTISGSVVDCSVPLTAGAWSGTITIANTGSNTRKLGTPATSATSCNSETTAAKTTSTLTAGPGDNGSSASATAFTMCSK